MAHLRKRDHSPDRPEPDVDGSGRGPQAGYRTNPPRRHFPRWQACRRAPARRQARQHLKTRPPGQPNPTPRPDHPASRFSDSPGGPMRRSTLRPIPRYSPPSTSVDVAATVRIERVLPAVQHNGPAAPRRTPWPAAERRTPGCARPPPAATVARGANSTLKASTTWFCGVKAASSLDRACRIRLIPGCGCTYPWTGRWPPAPGLSAPHPRATTAARYTTALYNLSLTPWASP